jgi:hypothetical protein
METTAKRGAAIADILAGGRSRRGERGETAGQALSSERATFFSRVREGRIIPVISGGLIYDSIFSRLVEQAAEAAAAAASDACAAPAQRMNGENLLAQGWAVRVRYPFPDSHELARVAQFNRWKKEAAADGEPAEKDDESAKREYLAYLKDSLLTYADRVLEEDVGLLDDLEARKSGLDFDEMAAELEYPRYPSNDADPLRILARLPLPIYITTSYHRFVENALTAEGKTPRSQVCYWCGDVECPEVITDPNYIPSVTEPVVFHMFGFDRCPSTLVLTEDDYLNFLVTLSQDTDINRSRIPPRITSALAVSSLMLLGYRLQDWDFRVLFRGIITARQKKPAVSNLILQLDPDQQYNMEDVGEARSYLKTYFQPEQFGVEWGKTDEYLVRLWQEYSEWIRNQ